MRKPFFWFRGAAVRQLFDEIGAAGPDTCRVEVHTRGGKMTFLVIPASTGDVTIQSHEQAHINDSHRCPPDCDGDPG